MTLARAVVRVVIAAIIVIPGGMERRTFFIVASSGVSFASSEYLCVLVVRKMARMIFFPLVNQLDLFSERNG